MAPTDPRTIWVGGDLLYTFEPVSFMALSRVGARTWNFVWRSLPFDYDPIRDISAHPRLDGLALSGHVGYVLRIPDHGASFRKVLQSSVDFFVDWGGGAGNVAFAV